MYFKLLTYNNDMKAITELTYLHYDKHKINSYFTKKNSEKKKGKEYRTCSKCP